MVFLRKSIRFLSGELGYLILIQTIPVALIKIRVFLIRRSLVSLYGVNILKRFLLLQIWTVTLESKIKLLDKLFYSVNLVIKYFRFSVISIGNVISKSSYIYIDDNRGMVETVLIIKISLVFVEIVKDSEVGFEDIFSSVRFLSLAKSFLRWIFF